jgi:hypothetical protein
MTAGMKPPVWRLVAVTFGTLLLIATALDCYVTAFGNSESAFSGNGDRAEPGFIVVTEIKHPDAIRGPLHVGDRVRLEDRSLAHRLDLIRVRIGERFVFVGTTRNGVATRFIETIPAAPPAPTAFWIYALMRVAFIVVGLLVAVRRPGDPAARLLVVMFLALAATMEWPQPWTPIWLSGFLVLVMGPVGWAVAAYAGIELAVTFPQPSPHGIRLFLQRLNPWLLAVTLAIAAATALMIVLGRTALWLVVLAPFEWLGLIAAFALALIIAIREATGANKQRARWVAYSLGIGVTGPTIQIILQATGAHLSALDYVDLTLLAFPLGLGYAIVRHRVIDIGFVVNRALVFGAVSAIVVTAFITLEWVLGTALVRISHVTSASLELGLALVLGFSLRSIHAKVASAVGDIFFRARREAERALRTFAHEVAYITDPRVAVARAHAELIARTGASGVAVYVVTGRDAVRIDPAKSSAQDRVDVDDAALVRMRTTRTPMALGDVDSALSGDHAFPMAVRGAVTGTVVLGAKTNGEAYAPDELVTVETVALALGNALDALHTAALKAEIARVLLDGAPLETLRRTADPAAWVRGLIPQPAGSILGLE